LASSNLILVPIKFKKEKHDAVVIDSKSEIKFLAIFIINILVLFGYSYIRTANIVLSRSQPAPLFYSKMKINKAAK